MNRFRIAALLLGCAPAWVSGETFDNSFNGNGRWVESYPPSSLNALAFLELPNGQLAAVERYTGSACSAPVCVELNILSASGASSLGSIFNELPFALIDGAAIDSSGRVVVVGTTPSGGAQGRDQRILRFRPNGFIDRSFGTDGFVTVDFFGLDDYATAVTIDQADNIVIAGIATLTPGDADFGVVRLRADGSLDSSFGGGGKRTVAFDLGSSVPVDRAYAVAIANDKRILLGGVAFDGAISRFRGALARLNTNGTLDATFCAGGCGYSSPYPSLGNGKSAYYFGEYTAHSDIIKGIAVAGNGSFFVVGHTSQPDDSGQRAAITRFTAAGEYSTEVLSEGVGGNASFNSVVLADSLGTRVIATGNSGFTGVTLLTQAFNAGLIPLADYGTCLASNSGQCFTGTNLSTDPGTNNAVAINLDRLGRPLLAADFQSASGAPRSTLFARFTNATGPKPDSIFRNGFQ